MTIAEGGVDKRHYAGVEDDFKLKSKLILCFPLFLSSGEIYGVLQVIDTSSQGARLNLKPEHMKILQDMVDIGSIALSNALVRDRHLQRVEHLTRTIDSMYTGRFIHGVSRSFSKVLELVDSYAATDYPVLIYGESGTGKEIIAREIHRRSRRNTKNMLIQNCSAIPTHLLESELFGYVKGAFTGASQNRAGLLEAANGGTVFLDELGEMEYGLQAKVLRALEDNIIKPLGSPQSRRINLRIISATNKNLEKAIACGEFRQDLFYRLNVLPVSLPPLRRRREDIPFLVEHFLKRESEFMKTPRKTRHSRNHAQAVRLPLARKHPRTGKLHPPAHGDLSGRDRGTGPPADLHYGKQMGAGSPVRPGAGKVYFLQRGEPALHNQHRRHVLGRYGTGLCRIRA